MKPKSGICVDGSCEGNPGTGEYQAIDIETGKVLFHQKFYYTTNNIMEFCGLVHAIVYCLNKGIKTDIYSDSVTAMSWVKKRNVSTSLVRDGKTEIMHKFIGNCISQLSKDYTGINILKWETKEWGENLADFGKKTNFESIKKSTLRTWANKERENERTFGCDKPESLAKIEVIDRLIKYFNL